jgi:hypothetical protein
MLNQLLSVMSPEMIIHAIKANPKVIIETLQKFDTFKLLGSSLSTEQQIVLSNNAPLLNDFLRSEAGRTAAYLWAEEFSSFVNKWKSTATTQEDELKRKEIEAKVKAEVESKVRAEVEERVRKEIESTAVAEIQDKIKAEIAARAVKMA